MTIMRGYKRVVSYALDDFKIEQKDRLFKFTVTRDQVSKSISIYLHG